jgi:hypothetical protein
VEVAMPVHLLCAHPWCATEIKWPSILCHSHWFALPESMKMRIASMLEQGQREQVYQKLDSYFAIEGMK